MKRMLALGLLAVCLFAALAPLVHAAGQIAGGYAELDRAAIEAYRRGDLDGAHEAWERCLADPQLARSSAEKGRILYDLGNVAYRQKQLLQAVGWYSAALHERPRDADTWANLEMARSEAHLEPEDRGDLAATLERLLTALTLREARWLALCAVLGWGLVLAGEACFGGRAWAWIARVSTVALVLLLLPWQVQSWREGRDEWLVVAAQPLALNSEPRADAAQLCELAPGTRARRVDELPDWIKLVDAEERVGWARRESLFALRR